MVIERNFATLSLISHIINDKYMKAVPLYRLEKDLAYWSINFSRQTMHNLDIAEAEMMIPLYELIQKLWYYNNSFEIKTPNKRLSSNVFKL